MKNFIKISALFIVLGLTQTTLFAAAPVNDPSKKDVVFTSTKNNDGINITVQKETAGKSVVLVYDQDNDIIYKDVLAKNSATYTKGYILNKLELGDYTIGVITDGIEVKKRIHVYMDENDRQSFFFMEQN
jgi:hypothetical protein